MVYSQHDALMVCIDFLSVTSEHLQLRFDSKTGSVTTLHLWNGSLVVGFHSVSGRIQTGVLLDSATALCHVNGHVADSLVERKRNCTHCFLWFSWVQVQVALSR